MKNIFNNWKTTLCGLAVIFTGIKGLITGQDFSASINTIIAGVGLLVAKDFNVTGQ